MKKNRDGNDYEVVNSIICVDDKGSDGYKMLGYTYGKLYYEVRSNDTTRRFLDDDGDLRVFFPHRFRNATLLEKELFDD